MNPPDIHYHVNLITFNPTTLTSPTSPLLMNTSILKILTEIPLNCINPIGFIWIDMFSDFMATSRKVLSKATLKIKETAKLRYYSTFKITQSKWTNRKSKTTDYQLENHSLEDKNVSDKTESFLLLTTSGLVMLLQFMEEMFTFTIVMNTPDNFSKN